MDEAMRLIEQRRELLGALRDLYELTTWPHNSCGTSGCVYCRVESILSSYGYEAALRNGGNNGGVPSPENAPPGRRVRRSKRPTDAF